MLIPKYRRQRWHVNRNKTHIMTIMWHQRKLIGEFDNRRNTMLEAAPPPIPIRYAGPPICHQKHTHSTLATRRLDLTYAWSCLTHLMHIWTDQGTAAWSTLTTSMPISGSSLFKCRWSICKRRLPKKALNLSQSNKVSKVLAVATRNTCLYEQNS